MADPWGRTTAEIRPRLSIVATRNTPEETFYHISVSAHGGSYSIQRTLAEFKALHRLLQHECKALLSTTPLIELPWLTLMINGGPGRMDALNRYLRVLQSSDDLMSLPSVQQFLLTSEMSVACKRGLTPQERQTAWPLLLSMRASLLPNETEYKRVVRQLRLVGPLDVHSDGPPATSADISASSSEQLTASLAGCQQERQQLQQLVAVDIGRTLPHLGCFEERDGALRADLERVLWVHCLCAHGLAYQQGRSHLAAVMLLALGRPPLACACLTALTAGFPILRACASLHLQPSIKFFDVALSHCAPLLKARLGSLAIPTDLYLTPWLCAFFARSLPLPIVQRIWDRVLASGEAVLFRAAIAIMRILQPALLVASFEDAVHLLHHLPFSTTASDESARIDVEDEGSDGASSTLPDSSAPERVRSTTLLSPLSSSQQLMLLLMASPCPEDAETGITAQAVDKPLPPPHETSLFDEMDRVVLPEAAFEGLLAECVAWRDTAVPMGTRSFTL